MRILLVVDGSSYSEVATRTVEALRLPPKTEVTVLTVVPEHTFLGGIRLGKLAGASLKREAQQQKATELLQNPVQALSGAGLNVSSLVRWGNPTAEILKLAEESRVSLVVMGAKGLSDPSAFRLGSVALKVIKYAGCSVLLARKKTHTAKQGLPIEKNDAVAMNRVLVAADGSKYSDRAAQFLLELPIPQKSHVIVITALQSHVAALLKTPTLDLEANRQLLADLQAAEEKEASKITARSEEQFKARGYRTNSVVIRGGAGESILKAAEESGADIIVLGSRGLTGIESLLLGSVAERVARYAPCSVLIVKPQKA